MTADRYVAGRPRQAIRGIVPLRGRPDDAAPQTTELLYGETFTVYEEKDGWDWGQCDADGYVGYARAGGLTGTVGAATHGVRALPCIVFPAPSVQNPPLKALSPGDRAAVLDPRAQDLRTPPDGGGDETRSEDGT